LILREAKEQSMSAYVIIDIDVHDPETYARYRELAPPIVAKYGGRYLARGGKVEALEGGWNPSRVVILEFENAEQAKRWWASEEYSRPKKMRHAASHSKMIVVEGLALS
jgi:uncharacterized protein (DUF1330 family)